METLKLLDALLEELDVACTRVLDRMEAAPLDKVDPYDSGRATAYFHAKVMTQSVRRAVASDLPH